jgi:quinol monooxygenase YgiN
MFARIVKMTFQPDKIDLFLENFHENKQKIRNFEGCVSLELFRDKNDPSIFFTYSYWKADNDLEKYRNSDLFKKVWSETKVLFSDKPEAWSINQIESLH